MLFHKISLPIFSFVLNNWKQRQEDWAAVQASGSRDEKAEETMKEAPWLFRIPHRSGILMLNDELNTEQATMRLVYLPTLAII